MTPSTFHLSLLTLTSWLATGGQCQQTSQSQTSSGSMAVYKPAVHWSVPMGNMSVLTPSSQVSLYYTPDGSADPSQEHGFAQVQSNTTHPMVILTHSKFMSDVSCNASSITITCSDKDALTYVSNHWPSAPPFVVSTLSQSCGNTTDVGQHSFFLVSKVSVSNATNKITLATMPEMAIGSALPNTTISWGVYSPSSGSNGTASASKSKRQAAPASTSVDPNAAAVTLAPAQSSPSVDCGAPPSNNIDGFFAATCGSPTFDQDIDNQIGYLSFDAANFTESLQEFVPNVDSDYLPADNNDFAPVGATSGKVKRGLEGQVKRQARGSTRNAPSVSARKPSSARAPAAKTQTSKGIAGAAGKKVAGVAATPPPKVQQQPPPVPVSQARSAAPPVSASRASVLQPRSSSTARVTVAGSSAVAARLSSSVTVRPSAVPASVSPAAPQSSSGGFFDSLNNLVAVGRNATVKLANVLQAGADLASAASDAFNTASNTLNNVAMVLSGSPKLNATLSLGVGLGTTTVPSVFGDAVPLFSQSPNASNENTAINIYCVGCNIGGTLTLFGSVTYSIFAGTLTAANAGFNGSISAGLNVGITANVGINERFDETLASVPLPGAISVPRLLTVGPRLTVTAEGGFQFDAQGQLLAGATVNIPDFGASLDLVNPNASTATGFNPQITRTFSLNANLNGVADIALPVGLVIGIEVPPVTFDQKAGIYNKPYAEATISATTASDAACPGLRYDLKVGNELFYNIFDEFKEIISNLTYPLAGQCLTLPGGTPKTPGRRSIEARQNPAPAAFSPISNGDPYNPINSPGYNETGAAAIAYARQLAQGPGTPGTFGATVDDPNATLVLIDDLSGTYGLDADFTTGNLLITTGGAGTPFPATSNDSVVLGDELGRFSHYYPNMMDRYGVSRFRMSDYTRIPIGSELIALAPITDDEGNDIYAAFDTDGNAFLPITCEFLNQPPKVFIGQADNLTDSIEALKDASLRYTVTGGVVTDCFYIPFGVGT